MKAVIHREGFLTAFSAASSVAPARTPKPILQNVKLDLSEDGAATLSATDLDMGIRYRVSGVTVEQPGSAVLPTAQMASILRELPDETLVLELDGGQMRVVGARSKFELHSPDPLQFPDVPDFGAGPGHKIQSAVLETMIKRTIFAIASENSRYHLNSVLLEFEPERLLMVATDGKRLAYMPGAIERAGEAPASYSLVPPKTLALVGKTLADPEEMIELAVRENEIHFRSAKVTVYSRLSDGRFPAYKEVFPPKPKVEVPLEAAAFLAVLRQAKIVTREDSKGVDFHFEDGSLVLSSQGLDVGESEVRMTLPYSAEPLDITFDPQLIIDMLRVLPPEEEVTLQMIDGRKAAVLRTRDQYAYVVMPLTRER